MQKQLIQWYQQNKRDFPWRKDQDPYHIWISEIMLQQTTTETVIPYYERFLENFSTIEALASASLEEVYKMWEGLGYYRRAKHLHESAQIIVEKYQGKFPYEYNDILSLKSTNAELWPWETSMFALSLPLHWIELIRRSPMSLCQLLPMALVEIAVLPASSTYGPVMSLERNMRIW